MAEERIVQRLTDASSTTKVDADREVTDANGVTRKLFAGTSVPSVLAGTEAPASVIETETVDTTPIGGEPVSTTATVEDGVPRIERTDEQGERVAAGAKAERGPAKDKAEQAPRTTK